MLGGWQLCGVFGRYRPILTQAFVFSPECRQMLETVHKFGRVPIPYIILLTVHPLIQRDRSYTV